MPVTEFECAIAKSQIGRYIAGDNLGNEVVRQLESHIGACPNCKKLLEEKRSDLMQMLDKPGDITAAVNPAPVTMTPAPPTGTRKDYEYEVDMAPKAAETPKAPTEKDLKAALREQLAARMLNAPQPKKNQPEVIEVPVVAAAFASKEAPVTETVQVVLNAPKAKQPKRMFNLNALALYKKVQDEETTTDAPALTVKNLKEAKKSFSANNPTMRKPLIYMVGLAAVVTAMSFVLKDPTSMFGPKAESNLVANNKTKQTPKKNPSSKSKTAKNKKVAMSSPLTGTKGTNAQPFVTPVPTGPVKNTAKLELNPTPVAKTKVTKTTVKATPKKAAPKRVEPKAKPVAEKPTRIRKKTTLSKPTVKAKTTKGNTTRSAKPKLRNSTPSTGTVRVYDADGNLIK